jgi:hypothetical protein
VNQQQWYRDYLAQGTIGLAGQATVWMLGDNIAEENPSLPLLATDMGLAGVTPDQGLNVNPDVHGVASFTFENGNVANFTGNNFSLSGGCPTATGYDGLGASGTATITHRYFSGMIQGPGAVVMNKNAALSWNTIFMSFTWYDIRDGAGPPTFPNAEDNLMSRILSGALPGQCLHSPNVTDVPGDPELSTVPAVTALYPCRPNPFNPTTEVRFDLSRRGPVRLEVFDAAGRLVRVLVHGETEPGRHRAVWNGMDASGNHAPSGVYFSRLVTSETTQTQKMVLLK